MHVELQNYYCVAKTVAEKTAMEEASKRGIHLVVVVPAFTLGETLQPALHLAMCMLIVSYTKGTKKAYPNTVSGLRNPSCAAAHGRYLCIGQVVHRSELFPQYPITTK